LRLRQAEVARRFIVEDRVAPVAIDGVKWLAESFDDGLKQRLRVGFSRHV
jgi:hypothetical protein